MKLKIRTLLILAITCFALTSMVIFSIFEHERIKKTAESQYKKMVLEIAEKQSQNVSMFFEYLKRKFSILAESTELEEYIVSISTNSTDNQEKYNDVIELLENYIQNDGINNFALIDKNNNVLVTTDPEIEHFVNSMLFSKFEDDSFFVYAKNIDEPNEDYSFTIKKTLSSDYYILGVFDSFHIKTMFERSTFSVNGRVILIDPQNQLIDSSYIGNLEEVSIPEYREFKNQIITNGFGQGILELSYEVGHNTRIGYLMSIDGTDWKLGIIGEEDKAFIHSNSALSNMLSCIIILGLFLIIINLMIIIYLTKPLYIIKKYISKIERGDYETRLNISTKGEFGFIVTAFNDLMDDLVISKSRYKTILDMSDNILFEWNFKNDVVSFSNNFNKKFSYRAPTETFEDSFLVKCIVHPDDAEWYKNDLESLKKGEAVKQSEYRWKNIYGDYIWILMRTAVIKSLDGAVSKVIGVILDIDRAKKSEKLLKSKASYDALTKLYNRETLESLINNEIDLIDARKNEFAVLFIDVDDFKYYNDNYSHATGDQVLKFTADTINSITSEYGIAGRYGGDEFVVCVRNSDINDPARTAQDMLNRLKEGFICDVGEKLSVSASIGIAVIRDSSKRVDEIIKLSDAAMYRIKKGGKSSYGFFNE